MTSFGEVKTLAQSTGLFGTLTGPWAGLSGVAFSATWGTRGRRPNTRRWTRQGAAWPARCCQALGWQNAAGNVLGLYVHGLFEDAPWCRHCWVNRCRTDGALDKLAESVQKIFDSGLLMSWSPRKDAHI